MGFLNLLHDVCYVSEQYWRLLNVDQFHDPSDDSLVGIHHKLIPLSLLHLKSIFNHKFTNYCLFKGHSPYIWVTVFQSHPIEDQANDVQEVLV